MLNKEICKRCVEERFLVDGSWNWSVIDEQDWAKGYVFCFLDLSFKIVEEGPRPQCRYLVEQFLHHDATEIEENPC